MHKIVSKAKRVSKSSEQRDKKKIKIDYPDSKLRMGEALEVNIHNKSKDYNQGDFNK